MQIEQKSDEILFKYSKSDFVTLEKTKSEGK